VPLLLHPYLGVFRSERAHISLSSYQKTAATNTNHNNYNDNTTKTKTLSHSY